MKVYRTFVSFAAAWAAFLSSASPAAAQRTPTLAIEFGERSVRVEGATLSGAIVWFSIASEASGYASTTVPRSGSSPVDSSGAATFDLEAPVPPHSIWAAVDLATGAFTLAAPGSYPLRQSTLNAGAIRADPSGQVSWLQATRTDLHLLLVRPGVGSWVGRFSEGSKDDADRESNGVLTAELLQMRAIGDSSPVPEEFMAHDVVIAIDPIQMEVISFRLQD